MPVAPYKKIKHIAVINHKSNNADPSFSTEIIYANTDNDVTGFAQVVIHILMKIYPKNGANSARDKQQKGDLALSA